MNTNQNMFLAFLQENIQRLFTKSPLFFKIWQIIAGILIIVSYLPDAVNWISGFVAIPDLWNAQVVLIVRVASVVALFMSSLVTQSKPVGVTKSGTVLKTTDKQLPFTIQAEQKAAVNIEKVELVSPKK